MSNMNVRLMKPEDFEAVVSIDEKVNKIYRPEYYKLKFEKFVESKDYIPTSLVVEIDGKVAGFIMGELFIGEYGLSDDRATLDTIGVDPDFQNRGIGKLLIEEYFEHLKTLNVKKVNTLVAWDDTQLIKFFSSNGFKLSDTINLEHNL
jgi:ribosomal protein S18 acetylase RimI-like enzyme